MTTKPDKRQIEQRLKSLEEHLKQENPVLLKVVRSFRQLDKVAYRMGLLERDDSFATRVPWWPLISLLGTFSSGKSSFINHYLGQPIQLTGNQAVDDKFTVLCYSSEERMRTLPGLALDADPRFPFYQISRDIEEVAEGEGRRVDAYLQLKTSNSVRLRGKILIDSPGFDADAQRTSTLRITDHIIDLSDLVLVFFDARHPEPGAMQDTLKHLVSDTLHRPDSNKFLYILNQIDTTAQEDNPEEVFAAWQRALAQSGLTAGRFYRIYNPSVAIPIEDENRRRRFESKRDEDLKAIYDRMEQVEVERAYRIIGVLEKTAKGIRDVIAPDLEQARRDWRRKVLWGDITVFGLLAVLLGAVSVANGYWSGMRFTPPGWMQWLAGHPVALVLSLVAAAVAAAWLHLRIRRFAAGRILRILARQGYRPEMLEMVTRAFRRNTTFPHSILSSRPVGWGNAARKRISRVLAEADGFVQALNDKFTNPSGESAGQTVTVFETPGRDTTAPETLQQPGPVAPQEKAPPPQDKGG